MRRIWRCCLLGGLLIVEAKGVKEGVLEKVKWRVLSRGGLHGGFDAYTTAKVCRWLKEKRLEVRLCMFGF